MPDALTDTSPRGFQVPDQSVIEHQTRRAFERMEIVLAEVDAPLDDLVTMTVFITVSGLTTPNAIIEIQGIAVLDA